MSYADLSYFPVLHNLCNDVAGESSLKIELPDGLNAGIIMEYAKWGPDCVLNNDTVIADVERRTLDWCGVDVTSLQSGLSLRRDIAQLKCGAAFGCIYLDTLQKIFSKCPMLGKLKNDPSLFKEQVVATLKKQEPFNVRDDDGQYQLNALGDIMVEAAMHTLLNTDMFDCIG